MKKPLLVFWFVVVALLVSVVAFGQITVPNTFVAGQTASAAQVNANFSALGTNALNRSGGTLTGNVTVEPGVTIDGVDLSAMFAAGGGITADKAIFLSNTVPQLTVGWDSSHQLTFSVDNAGALVVDGNAAGERWTFNMPVTMGSSLTVTGAATFAGTATFNGAVSFPTGAILETMIADGALLARMAAAESITGAWSFRNTTSFLGAGASLTVFGDTNQPANSKLWGLYVAGATLSVITLADNLGGQATGLSFTRNAAGAITNATLQATGLTLNGELSVTSTNTVFKQAGVARIWLGDLSASTNEQYWTWTTTAGELVLYAYLDNWAGANAAISLNRSGTVVDSIRLTGTNLYLTGAAHAESSLTVTGTGMFNGLVALENNQPQWIFKELDAAVNQKYWRWAASANAFYMETLSDAFGAGQTAIYFGRSGTTISQITLTGTAISLAGNLDVSGTTIFSNTVTFNGEVTVAGSIFAGTGQFNNLTATTSASLTGVSISGETATINAGLLNVSSQANFNGVTAFSGTILSHIVPFSAYTYDLGQDSKRWRSIYGDSVWVTAGVINSSDQDLKKDIQPLTSGLDLINQLKPKSFQWKEKTLPGTYYGFLAQDLEKISFPGVVKLDGKPVGARYQDLLAPLVKSVQELHQDVKVLTTKVGEQQLKIASLQRQLNRDR